MLVVLLTFLFPFCREDGLNPDVWTYSNLIRCLADANLWRRAVGILDDMLEEGGVEPDAHCFNGAISACSKVLCGMVWCGMVWYGMVWCGVVWYGMV